MNQSAAQFSQEMVDGHTGQARRDRSRKPASKRSTQIPTVPTVAFFSSEFAHPKGEKP
jgi:hypothetical protein